MGELGVGGFVYFFCSRVGVNFKVISTLIASGFFAIAIFSFLSVEDVDFGLGLKVGAHGFLIS